MMFDTVIRDTTIVEPLLGEIEGSIGIIDGKIAAVMAPGLEADAAETIDGRGLHAFPGVVEPHTHLGYAREFEDDVRTETQSAAMGGVTTVLSFHRHYQSAQPDVYRDLPQLIQVVDDVASVDVGLHLGILTESQVRELESYIDAGVSSFKFYMAYRGEDGRTVGMINECDDGLLFEALEILGRHPHAVAGVHCENTEIIGRFVRRAKESGIEGLPAWHAARPTFGEVESVHRVGLMARETGANVYVVHAGSPEVVAAASSEKQLGTRLWIETCPHYLGHAIDSAAGNLAKINPPVRPRESVEQLWEMVRDGLIDTIGTDHCAVGAESKRGSIWDASAGFTGMATSLPVMLTEGHFRRGVPLVDIARMMSQRPAEIFNMPRKGRIVVDADADIALVDLTRRQRVDTTTLRSASDFSIFEGRELRGWPVRTMVRGKTVMLGGEIVTAASGQFVRR